MGFELSHGLTTATQTQHGAVGFIFHLYLVMWPTNYSIPRCSLSSLGLWAQPSWTGSYSLYCIRHRTVAVFHIICVYFAVHSSWKFQLFRPFRWCACISSDVICRRLACGCRHIGYLLLTSLSHGRASQCFATSVLLNTWVTIVFPPVVLSILTLHVCNEVRYSDILILIVRWCSTWTTHTLSVNLITHALPVHPECPNRIEWRRQWTRWQQLTQQLLLSQQPTHELTPLKSVRRPLLPIWLNFWPSFKVVALVEVVALVAAEADLCCIHYLHNDGGWIHPGLISSTATSLFPSWNHGKTDGTIFRNKASRRVTPIRNRWPHYKWHWIQQCSKLLILDWTSLRQP